VDAERGAGARLSPWAGRAGRPCHLDAPEKRLSHLRRVVTVSGMVRAIDHINIIVADLERAVRFYTEVLGFRKTKEAYLEGAWIDRIVGLQGVRGRVAYVVAPAGEPRIELLCYEAPRGAELPDASRANTIGLRHIALRVDDMAATVARLRAAGVTLFSEPVHVPAGVVKHDAGEKTLVYFLDPDGVILELAEYR
jgi:glyoxylase I family protein